MKKNFFSLVIFLAATVSVNAAQNYNVGNFMVGIGLGAGTSSINPIGAAQMTLQPSVELIVATWAPKGTGIALGITVDSSINLFNGLTGTIAPMLTTHVTIAPRFDWYVSLGMGLQLLNPSGTTGSYNMHVGFATGFNVMITPAWFFTTGLAIHANQFFGTAGVKIRFGDASKIQYRK